MRHGSTLITAAVVATMLGAIGTLLIIVGFVAELAPVFAILAFDMIAFSAMGLVIERRRPGIGGSALGLALFVAVPLLALLFPEERLPGPRWRIPVALTLGAIVASAVIYAVQPGPVNVDLAENPLGIDSELVVALGQLALPLETIGILAGAVLAVAAVATRFRRSSGLERQQVKWLLWAVVLIGLTLPASIVDGNGDTGFTILDALAVGSLSLLPISVGIAVTRYRLHEIDRIISRTLGWAVVTGILVAVFAGLVVALQAVLAPVTNENTLAVAASTLVAAALFQPLRRRVQRAVDRRFDRARYDGERTAAAFAERLRDEIDLDRFGADLTAAANATMRPRTATMWLRGGRA